MTLNGARARGVGGDGLLLLLSSFLIAGPALAAAPEPSDQTSRALMTRLGQVLDRPAMKAARVGVVVQSLDDGEILFQRNGDELLNPASNVKLVTAAATLARLGPDYRFATEFLTDAELDPAKGRAKILYVRGKGDPTITTERLYAIAGELFHAGLREVEQVVVDDSWFDEEREAPGYEQDSGDRAYLAPTGALSLNWNTVAVYLRPGGAPGSKASVEVEPDSAHFVVEGSLRTGKRSQHRWSVRSDRASGDRQKLSVVGSVGVPDVVRRRIDLPDLYFGHTLAELLRDRGVKVKKVVKRGTVPDKARLLHVSWSDTFDVVLKVMNKTSQNFVAEQLLKTLGAEIAGAPGSTRKGVEVVEDFLAREVGIPRGTYVVRNGSGLNDTNRMSAVQLTRMLRYMSRQFPMSAEYLSSVPIAGKDGTLRNRFSGSEAEAFLRAKTGTLENVSALSGYVQTRDGRRYAFAFMVNDFDWRKGGRKAVMGGMDALGVAVASSGGSADTEKGTAVARAPDAEAQSLARLRTYLALGGQRDARNLPFLRTAWRTESDPAVRAVVADALYQSSPEDFFLAQALLETYSPEAEVFGRLLKVARSESLPVPGVGSVVELAARGNQDALRLLLSLTHAAGAESASAELSEGLADVGRTAPDELLGALQPLSNPERETVTQLLAKGLGTASAAKNHPLWSTLKKASQSTDAMRASLARATESALTTHLARLLAAPASEPAPGDDATRATRPGG